MWMGRLVGWRVSLGGVTFGDCGRGNVLEILFVGKGLEL